MLQTSTSLLHCRCLWLPVPRLHRVLMLPLPPSFLSPSLPPCLLPAIAHIKDSITTRVHLLDRLAALRAERGLSPDGGNSRNALYEGEWGGEIEVGEGEEVEED
jgi:hypothetical protein